MIDLTNDLTPMVALFNGAKWSGGWKNENKHFNSLDELIKKHPNKTGQALLTGNVSGIMVVDLDISENANGIETMNGLLETMTKEDREVIENTFTVRTTNGGKHLYFNYQEGLTNIAKILDGVDIRTDGGIIVLPNSKVTKKDGSIGTYEVLIDNDIADMPKSLFDILLSDNKKSQSNPPTKKSYNEIVVTGGRNDALTRYIGSLCSRDTLSYEEISILAKHYDLKYLNPPIASEPNGIAEIESTIASIFNKDTRNFFDAKGKFLHEKLADYMYDNYDIIRLNNQLYIYDEQSKTYCTDKKKFKKAIKQIKAHLSDSQKEEVIKDLDLLDYEDAIISDAKFIGLKDKILNIETMEEINYSPQYIITNKINSNYNAHAHSEIVDKTLNKIACHDQQVRALIEEMLGYAIYRSNKKQVSFILTGGGSNGKSTLLNSIKKMVGEENISNLELKDLEDKNLPAELENKLINLGDDISATKVQNSSIFKKCVSGEAFMAQRKYGQPFVLENYATMIFSANNCPQFTDTTNGVIRRIIMIPFNASFSPIDVDFEENIEDKLHTKESLEYLLKLAIDGLRRILTNGFTKCDKADQEKMEYERSNNNIIAWLEEEPKIERELIGEVYQKYAVWCAINSETPIKKITFSKEIKKRCGMEAMVKKISGKTCKIYEKNLD